jgi:hypothetical protein
VRSKTRRLAGAEERSHQFTMTPAPPPAADTTTAASKAQPSKKATYMMGVSRGSKGANSGTEGEGVTEDASLLMG